MQNVITDLLYARSIAASQPYYACGCVERARNEMLRLTKRKDRCGKLIRRVEIGMYVYVEGIPPDVFTLLDDAIAEFMRHRPAEAIIHLDHAFAVLDLTEDAEFERAMSARRGAPGCAPLLARTA